LGVRTATPSRRPPPSGRATRCSRARSLHPGGAEAPPDDAPDPRIVDIVDAGHRDGTIDPLIGAVWVENLLWATPYAFRMTPVQGASAFDLRNQAVRTLLKAVAADPASI